MNFIRPSGLVVITGARDFYARLLRGSDRVDLNGVALQRARDLGFLPSQVGNVVHAACENINLLRIFALPLPDATNQAQSGIRSTA